MLGALVLQKHYPRPSENHKIFFRSRPEDIEICLSVLACVHCSSHNKETYAYLGKVLVDCP